MAKVIRPVAKARALSGNMLLLSKLRDMRWPLKKLLSLLGPALIWFLLVSSCLIIFAPQSLGIPVHEYLGTLLMVLVIYHVGRNRYVFYPSSYKDVSAAVRLKNVTALLLLASFIAMMISGIFISTEVFEALELPGMGPARTIHLSVSAYAQLLLGLHIGMHVSKLQSFMTEELGRRLTNCVLSLLIICAANGLLVFYEGDYRYKLLFEQSFSFWDYDRSLWLSYTDMACVMCFYGLIGFLLMKLLSIKIKASQTV